MALNHTLRRNKTKTALPAGGVSAAPSGGALDRRRERLGNGRGLGGVGGLRAGAPLGQSAQPGQAQESQTREGERDRLAGPQLNEVGGEEIEEEGLSLGRTVQQCQ